MNLFQRMRDREDSGRCTVVAVIGAGLMGRGIIRQIQITPGMRVGLVINRTTDKAVDALRAAGLTPSEVLVSDDAAELTAAIKSGRAAVTSRLDLLGEVQGVDVMTEFTGAVEYGARAAVIAIDHGLHVIMMNAETDATVGCALKARADARGVVYTNSDGDQPGVLKRLIDYVEGLGFESVAAINCKGFMDVNATPETIAPWAKKQNTSLPMTTAFTDGTKMNIELGVLGNATGMIPDCRGMHGINTCLATALPDCMEVFNRRGLLDYTLGGDFGGGVFVIGYGDDPEMVQPYMSYLKMGDGPNYVFYRPYHLCHFETPLSIAEVVLDGLPTIAPLGGPILEVVTVAKCDLQPGDTLDGIGGFTCYGEVDTIVGAHGCIPIGLTEGLTINRAVPAGEAVPLQAVTLDESNLLIQLWREQSALPVRAAA